jgi:radical SAM superfamily enzyme YgiQ (UPF0313 family)
VRLEKREARVMAYPERNISDGLRQGFSFRPVIYRYRAPINFEPFSSESSRRRECVA